MACGALSVSTMTLVLIVYSGAIVNAEIDELAAAATHLRRLPPDRWPYCLRRALESSSFSTKSTSGSRD
jgi:hypothetical protein